jgi:hypothetical protein
MVLQIGGRGHTQCTHCTKRCIVVLSFKIRYLTGLPSPGRSNYNCGIVALSMHYLIR